MFRIPHPFAKKQINIPQDHRLPDLALPFCKINMILYLPLFVALTALGGWLLVDITSDSVNSRDFSIFTLFDLGYIYFYLGGLTLLFFLGIAVFLFRLFRKDNLLVLQWDGFSRNKDIVYNRKIYWSEISDIYLKSSKEIAIVFKDPDEALSRATPLNRKIYKLNKEHTGEYFILNANLTITTTKALYQQVKHYWQTWQKWETAQKLGS